jgi:hypothetical protein
MPVPLSVRRIFFVKVPVFVYFVTVLALVYILVYNLPARSSENITPQTTEMAVFNSNGTTLRLSDNSLIRPLLMTQDNAEPAIMLSRRTFSL